MSYRLSRLLSTATAGYGVFALAQPDHLGKALEASGSEREGYALLARTYGVRDLPVSALGMFGRSGKTVKAAMLIRIAFDLGDCALLATKVEDEEIRKKVMAVTLGWAAANTLALVIDNARNEG